MHLLDILCKVTGNGLINIKLAMRHAAKIIVRLVRTDVYNNVSTSLQRKSFRLFSFLL